MRKIVLPLLSVLFLLSSCQETPDKDVVVQNSIEDMNKITGELLDFASNNLSSFLSVGTKGEVWFDQHQMALDGMNHLDGRFIDGSKLDFKSLAAPFGKVHLSNINSRNRLLEVDYGTFSVEQISYADPFIGNLLAVDDLRTVGELVFTFNTRVRSSTLTQEEKDELFLLSSAAISLS
ncbi:hypothetical protein, partial [Algoriphagus sp.]|uniref:hypothetical protein n=1 Tax=Algoriphagus sp. TaxID=1872435 RepID=UPI003F70FAF5